MTATLVFLGAMVGAPLRYLTDRAMQRRAGSRLPWGTLTVNVIGSLVLGVLVGLKPSAEVIALVGTGMCGALTTYSTFSFETWRLIEERSYVRALLNVVLSLVLCIGAAAAGYLIAG